MNIPLNEDGTVDYDALGEDIFFSYDGCDGDKWVDMLKSLLAHGRNQGIEEAALIMSLASSQMTGDHAGAMLSDVLDAFGNDIMELKI